MKNIFRYIMGVGLCVVLVCVCGVCGVCGVWWV